MTKMVPIVAIVDEETAYRLNALVAKRRMDVADPEAMAMVDRIAAENGWDVEMMVAGSILRQAIALVVDASTAPPNL